MEKLKGRIIYSGQAEGTALKSEQPISFFGAIDAKTGIVKDAGHPLFGISIAGKVLIFPTAKGSTVGSYILYSLKKMNAAPAAMILSECETIVAVGAIISEIPTIDLVQIKKIKDGDFIKINGDEITIEDKSNR